MQDKQKEVQKKQKIKIYPILPIRITYQSWVSQNQTPQNQKLSYFDIFMRENQPCLINAFEKDTDIVKEYKDCNEIPIQRLLDFSRRNQLRSKDLAGQDNRNADQSIKQIFEQLQNDSNIPKIDQNVLASSKNDLLNIRQHCDHHLTMEQSDKLNGEFNEILARSQEQQQINKISQSSVVNQQSERNNSERRQPKINFIIYSKPSIQKYEAFKLNQRKQKSANQSAISLQQQGLKLQTKIIEQNTINRQPMQSESGRQFKQNCIINLTKNKLTMDIRKVCWSSQQKGHQIEKQYLANIIQYPQQIQQQQKEREHIKYQLSANIEESQPLNEQQISLHSPYSLNVSKLRKKTDISNSLNSSCNNLQKGNQQANSLSQFNVRSMIKTMPNPDRLQQIQRQAIIEHQQFGDSKRSTKEYKHLRTQVRRNLNNIIQDLDRISTVKVGLTISKKKIMVSDITR